VRWGRVRFPSVNSYVQAMGDLVGFAAPGVLKAFVFAFTSFVYPRGQVTCRSCRFSRVIFAFDSAVSQASSCHCFFVLFDHTIFSLHGHFALAGCEAFPCPVAAAADTSVDPVRSLDVDDSPSERKSASKRVK